MVKPFVNSSIGERYKLKKYLLHNVSLLEINYWPELMSHHFLAFIFDYFFPSTWLCHLHVKIHFINSMSCGTNVCYSKLENFKRTH